jgi:hypothetical protein
LALPYLPLMFQLVQELAQVLELELVQEEALVLV